MSAFKRGILLVEQSITLEQFELMRSKIEAAIIRSDFHVLDAYIHPQPEGFFSIFVLQESYVLIQTNSRRNEVYLEIMTDSDDYHRFGAAIDTFDQIAKIFNPTNIKAIVL